MNTAVANPTSRLLVPVNSEWKNNKSGRVTRIIEVRPYRETYMIHFRDDSGHIRRVDLALFRKKWTAL